MGVLAVRRVTLIGLKKDTEDLMSILQNASMLHINPINSSLKKDSLNYKEILKEERLLKTLSEAIAFLKNYEAKSDTPIPSTNDKSAIHKHVCNLITEFKDNDEKINHLKKTLKVFEPFGEFKQSTKPLLEAGLILKLAIVNDNELKKLEKDNLSFKILNKNKDENYVAVLLKKGQESPFTLMDPPVRPLQAMRDEIDELKVKNNKIEQDLRSYYYKLNSLKKWRDEVLLRNDRLKEMTKLKNKDQFFGISGYVLKKDVDQLKNALKDFFVAIQIDTPKKGDDVPVKLNNPKFFDGFESILRAFSGINYFEKDKTPLVFILFVFFGALCFLDAGYGLLLFLLGYVLNIKNYKAFGQVFMWTGGIAFILGLMCGQIFGLVFAKDILLNIPPLLSLATDPLACFHFSLLVGLFIMALANLVAVDEQGIRSQPMANFLLITSLSLFLLSSNNSFFESNELKNALYIAAYILTSLSVLFFILFPEPVFGRHAFIGNALWALYSAPVGLIQDILSHMRLFGIALSGAILALVINKIGSMMPFIFGMIFVSLGHFFVFLLALLSLYIHTNRLIFLEFGSKCISGGHNYFKPFARRTLS